MSTYKKYGGQGKKLIKVNKTLEGQSGKLNSKVKKKKPGDNYVLENSVTVRVEIRMLLNYTWQ